MPRYNVEADGEWACFSSVVDAFITPFMPKKEYEKWRDNEYGAENVPLEKANKMSLKAALFALSLNKTDEEIVSCLREAGLIDSSEYEEEKQDLLLKLPCRVGENLFAIQDKEPRKYTVKRISVLQNDCIVHLIDRRNCSYDIIPEQIGIEFYRTMEEALKELAEDRKNEQSSND